MLTTPDSPEPAAAVEGLLQQEALRPAAQDYLAAVACLAEAGGPVTGVQVARLLRVSEPSVTQMLQRLGELDLVGPGTSRRAIGARRDQRADVPAAAGGAGDAAPHPGITLTPTGGAAAAWLLYRRRVCECFFVDGLGLDWPAARTAAHQMEHGLTAATVQQLHHALGVPTRCPHGNPLWSEGQPAPIAALAAAAAPEAPADDLTLPLSQVTAGTAVVVERLTGAAEQDADSLAYLQEHGIRPGQTLVVEGLVPHSDMLQVRVGRRRCALSPQLTAPIGVRRKGAGRSGSRRAPRLPPPGPCRGDGGARITAVRVDGPCRSGHREGDSFLLAHETPAGLCGNTYAALFPCVQRLLAIGRRAAPPGLSAVSFERRCPGEGYVTWRVEPLHEAKAS